MTVAAAVACNRMRVPRTGCGVPVGAGAAGADDGAKAAPASPEDVAEKLCMRLPRRVGL